MASRIPPTPPRPPLFRRLVRENGPAGHRYGRLEDSGSETIRIPEGLRYPQAMMHIEDMEVLLNTPHIRPRPESDVPYEDTEPPIEQYSFDLPASIGLPANIGSIVSRRV